ncbi:MAG: hypothetical protein N2449_08865 [Bacteroidales bacterium]|nr:hypothetical protein [Bacteroidales bacterium]
MEIKKLIANTIKTAFVSANEVSWTLIKVYVPLSILATLLKQYGFFDWLSPYMLPVMEAMGLPGKAAVTILASFFGNVYAGIATIPALNLTVREITILGIIIGFSHSLIIETGILIKLRFATYRIALFRILLGLISGIIANLLLPQNIEGIVLNPYLQGTDNIDWFNILMGIVTTIIQIWLLVFLLQFLYDTLRQWSFVQFIKPYICNIGSFFGLSAGGIVPWLVGLFLGIIYGSGIMLQFAKKGVINHKDASLITVFLVLAHAIIEDSLLFAIVGGNFWIIFLSRTIIAFLILKLLSFGQMYKKLHFLGVISEQRFHQYKSAVT